MTPDRVLKTVDAVIVGVGWAGSIIASELTKAGMDVVALERGPWRDSGDPAYVDKHDELLYRQRQGLLHDYTRETWTFRHHENEPALPIRYAGAFRPANGVGGSSGHYGALTCRLPPWEFEIRSRIIERYGETAVPEAATIQDWGITYDELEPYYDRMERHIGVSSQAGNVRGELRDGGNPFEGPRDRDYPLPPPKHSAAGVMLTEACRSLGLHPYPAASAILSREYTNPDGVTRSACTYCGDCSFYLCAVHAKGDAAAAVLPVAVRSGRLDLRPNSHVVRVLHDGGRATGVLYRDAGGALVEQPAEHVIVSAYALNNTRLLLLSRMGEAYDPRTETGTIGRNYSYQVMVPCIGFFGDSHFKNYISSSAGFCVDDYGFDNFDHAGLGFVGGGTLMYPASGGVLNIPLPPGSPAWGVGWKQALHDWYDRSTVVSACGHSLSYRKNFLDLDPTYTDAWGEPLLRITFDWHDNERRLARFLTERAREVLEAAGADAISIVEPEEHFDVSRYQTTHNMGGAIMGSDPRTSVVNSYLQMWDYENVWVVGGSAFPQNGTPGPTGTIGALAYRAAEGILAYAERPGALVADAA